MVAATIADRTIGKDALARRRRHARNMRVALAIVFITFFGVVAPDYHALGGNPEEVVFNHFYRGFGFMVAGTIFVISAIQNGAARDSLPLCFVSLCASFAYYGITGALLYGSSASEFGVIVYRIAEWLTIIVVVHQAVFTRRSDAEEVGENLLRVAKMLVQLTFLVLILYLIAIPGNVLSPWGRFQMGGAAIHPNRLGFVAALGVLLFGLFPRGNLRHFWFLASLLAVVLAGSRVGFAMGLIALGVVLSSRLPPALRVAGMGLVTLLALVGSVFFLANPAPLAWLGSVNSEVLTLNGRIDVWRTSLDMLEQSPLIGWGLILGPKQIGQFLRQSWWNATNAQGDIVGALVAGGYLGLLLHLCLLAVLLFYCWRAQGEHRRFVVGAVLLYLISSSFEPFFVHNVGAATVLMLVVLRLADHWSRRASQQLQTMSGVTPQAAQSAPARPTAPYRGAGPPSRRSGVLQLLLR